MKPRAWLVALLVALPAAVPSAAAPEPARVRVERRARSVRPLEAIEYLLAEVEAHAND